MWDRYAEDIKDKEDECIPDIHIKISFGNKLKKIKDKGPLSIISHLDHILREALDRLAMIMISMFHVSYINNISAGKISLQT